MPSTSCIFSQENTLRHKNLSELEGNTENVLKLRRPARTCSTSCLVTTKGGGGPYVSSPESARPARAGLEGTDTKVARARSATTTQPGLQPPVPAPDSAKAGAPKPGPRTPTLGAAASPAGAQRSPLPPPPPPIPAQGQGSA